MSARLRGYVTATLTIAVPSAEMRQDIALRPERAAVRPGPITRTPVSVGAVEVRKVNLEGQVVGPSGSPVVVATVSLGQSSTRTDRTGRFVISNLATGTYQITIIAGGYAQYRATVTVRAGMPSATFRLVALARPPFRIRIP